MFCDIDLCLAGAKVGRILSISKRAKKMINSTKNVHVNKLCNLPKLKLGRLGTFPALDNRWKYRYPLGLKVGY
jgi:hypothetical protein